MAITANFNTGYGGTLVTEKYTPLRLDGLIAADKAYYSALLTHRRALLSQVNVLPRSLGLRAADWNAMNAIEATAGRLPPLVVISSGRANWIASGLAAAQQRLEEFDLPAFAGPSDWRAIRSLSGLLQSSPLYAPSRIGGNRSVYIVVHAAEYAFYQAALGAIPGLTIVGWSFDEPHAKSAASMLAGFGASRYAALALCKTLRAQAVAAGPAHWDYAWLLDDNVVALPGFPGFGAVETALATNPTRICAGVSGCSSAATNAENRAWAGTAPVPPALPAVPPSRGLVQQASCWNINLLQTRKLNFSPVFVASGEDVSLSGYLDALRLPYFYYSSISVRKEIATADPAADDPDDPAVRPNKGAVRVRKARRDCAAYFARAESSGVAGAGEALPPPVMIDPANPPGTPRQTLADYVANFVLPGSQYLSELADDEATRADAACQAVEQIVCKAIPGNVNGNVGQSYITADELEATFKIDVGVHTITLPFVPPPPPAPQQQP